MDCVNCVIIAKKMFSRVLVSYAGWQSYRDPRRRVNVTVDNGYSEFRLVIQAWLRCGVYLSSKVRLSVFWEEKRSWSYKRRNVDIRGFPMFVKKNVVSEEFIYREILYVFV